MMSSSAMPVDGVPSGSTLGTSADHMEAMHRRADVQVRSKTVASSVRNDPREAAMGASSKAARRSPARSALAGSPPADSSASSGSYRSVVSPVRSTNATPCDKSSASKHATSGKKRPLSASNTQSQPRHAKHTRDMSPLHPGDENGDRRDQKASRSDQSRRRRRRSVAPHLSEGESKLVRAHRAVPHGPSGSPQGAQTQLATRMAEHLFHHSSALLYHGNLENETRAEDVLEEVRRQRDKHAKYDRKIRSLQRELEALDPAAAAAYARGESISLIAEPDHEPAPTQPPLPTQTTQPPDMLTPAGVPEREAGIRAVLHERNAHLATFADELRGLDEFVEMDRHFSRSKAQGGFDF